MSFIKKGYFYGELTLENGSKIQLPQTDNLIVRNASLVMATSIKNEGPGVKFMAIGTDGTVENSTDSALKAEIGRSAVTTAFHDINNAEGDTMTYNHQGEIFTNKIEITAVFGSEIVGQIAEIATFGGPLGEIMINRKTFAPLNKPPGSSIQYTWVLVF